MNSHSISSFGRWMMSVAKYAYTVLVNPKPGREREWDAWHRSHVDDVLAVPGITRCRRYRAAPVQRDGAQPGWGYLAIYELETDTPAAAFDEIRRRMGTARMPMSDSADPAEAVTVLWEPISRHEKSSGPAG